MPNRSLLSICLLLVCFAVHAYGEPEQLTNQTFLDDVQAGRVKSVEIATGYPRSEHELMVTATKDGKDVTYYVDRPYRAEEDPIFIDFLKTHQIPYTLVKKEEGESFFSGGLSALFFFFGPPIVIFVTLLKIMSRIRTIREEVASLRAFIEDQPARDMTATLRNLASNDSAAPADSPEP